MAERTLVLCVGLDSFVWDMRLKVLEAQGTVPMLVAGPGAACVALSKQRFAAAIIGNEYSPQEQGAVESMILQMQEKISILSLPRMVTPSLLASFVRRLCTPQVSGT